MYETIPMPRARDLASARWMPARMPVELPRPRNQKSVSRTVEEREKRGPSARCCGLRASRSRDTRELSRLETAPHRKRKGILLN
jgi:hypothetical protein